MKWNKFIAFRQLHSSFNFNAANARGKLIWRMNWLMREVNERRNVLMSEWTSPPAAAQSTSFRYLFIRCLPACLKSTNKFHSAAALAQQSFHLFVWFSLFSEWSNQFNSQSIHFLPWIDGIEMNAEWSYYNSRVRERNRN